MGSENVLDKLGSVQSELNQYFLEREKEVKLSLTAVAARQHMLLLGPVGTAKTQLIEAVAQHLDAGYAEVDTTMYFRRLLTRFTVPEELFGPWDFQALKTGVFKRVIKGKLPTARIVFLDEIFKGQNSAVLNTLLTLINERKFENNDKIIEVPLISLFCASNELPDWESEQGQELQALYDRIHLKTVVRPVSRENWLKLWDLPPSYTPKTKIDPQQLVEAAENVDIRSITGEALEIRNRLEDNGVMISDRRWIQAKTTIKAYTLVNGKQKATPDDLEVLGHMFWWGIEEQQKVQKTVFEVCNVFEMKAIEIVEILDELKEKVNQLAQLTNPAQQRDTFEVYNKLASMHSELEEILRDAKAQGRRTDTIEKVQANVAQQLRRMQKILRIV